MPFKYAVTGLKLSGGSEISFAIKGTSLIVGPNNVGKSRCLREIAVRMGAINESIGFVATTSITENREGTAQEFYDWMVSKYRVASEGDQETISGVDVAYSVASARAYVEDIWGNPDPSALRYIGSTIASLVETGRRLHEADPTASYDAIEQPPRQAIHALYAHESLEAKVSASFRKAFGMDLVVDRLGGSKIALRCGERPDAQVFGAELSMAYQRAVRALPPLHEQGDGMRSYVACLLHTDVRQRPTVLIDEPEAFLHPPQARVLAQHLAREASTLDRQVILATHSSDVVRGVLDVSADVSVIRLTRTATGNQAKQIDATAIRRLWEDPLLRASNLLDALFHRRLILCEADGDCRFYNAVLEAMCADLDRASPDVMFAHTGGKDRLPTAVTAIASVDVPVSVIADIDILVAENPLRKIWEGLGGSWGDIDTLRRRVDSGVRDTLKKLSREYIRERALAVLDENKEEALDDASADRIRSLLRADGGWAAVKRGGLAMIPKGEARAAADELVTLLATRGLHVVPVGELEGFAPSIGRHGPAWVSKALSLDLARGSETIAARDFVRSLGVL